MELAFITGNKGKFAEIEKLIPHIKQLDIDLPEIQEIDPHLIISAKLREAFIHHKGPFIVEDTSFYIDELNGLPGPLIKWFLHSLKVEGLYRLVSHLQNKKALAKTCIGFARSPDDIHFFEGSIAGIITKPRGNNGFGWDSIFQPNGQEKTFAEMSLEEKLPFSMRQIAVEKLRIFLQK